MAMRIRNRRRSRINRYFLSPLDSGESALVDDSRAKSAGGRDCCGRGTKNLWRPRFGDRRTPLQRAIPDAHSHSHAYALARDLERDCARTSATFVSWFRAHVNAGIFL